MDSSSKAFTLGALDFLAISLILLKATGNTTLPWLWVLAPWWIPLTITLGIITAASLAEILTRGGK